MTDPRDVANPRLGAWSETVIAAPDDLQELCPGWFVQYAPGAPRDGVTFERALAKKGEGMRIRVAEPIPWLRVWQPFTVGDLDAPERRLRMTMKAGRAPAERLSFSWAAVLRANDRGRRILARRIHLASEDEPDIHRIEAAFSVARLSATEPYYLALQFGGTGEIVLRSCQVDAPVARRRPAPPAVVPEPGSPRRVAVVGWELSHNPAGRAYLLADVAAQSNVTELVGPLFPNFGGRIWPPIADQSAVPIRTFPAHDLTSLVEGARALAATVRCDVVYVSKPRLPSLLLGALIKQANDCPMIVDVDDRETSFFLPAEGRPSLAELDALARTDPGRITSPFSDAWTRFCEGMVAEADGVTVSNAALQELFGGTIVRHARDERVFDPALYDRAAVRAEFGYGPDDRVVLFLGTPRPHKGVFAIADAMEKLALPNLALCVIGSMSDKRVSSRFDPYERARIALHPDQPWSRLPELVGMADAVMVLQDSASPISEYQIPAKLTDALAMGVPVYATPVTPLADLIQAGAIRSVPDVAALEEALRQIAQGDAEPSPQESPARDVFRSNFSYAVNGTRIDAAIEQATKARRESVPAFDELFALIEAITDRRLPRFERRPALREHRRGRFRPLDGGRDVVYLWKQNDSDIYGRRADMLTKYLLRSGYARRVLHFDAPITPASLERHLLHAEDAIAHQGKYVYVNTVRRALKMADDPQLFRRTFVHRSGSKPERFLGHDLPGKDGYAEFVARSVEEAGIGPNALLIVSPVVFDYETVRDVVDPALILADVVDDQRQWPTKSDDYRRKLTAGYEAIMRDAEVVISNCEPVRERFAALREDIHVVSNGTEIFPGASQWAVPADLARLPRPIIGYVGNLRDRVDFALVRKVAAEHRSGSVVMIGSAHDSTHVEDLADVPNIHFLGVRPYADAVRYIRAFDVAMMPHLVNELTQSMNPLKLYVYVALGVPVVTTAVPNIDDVASGVNVATSHTQFLRKLRLALAGDGVRLPAYQRKLVVTRSSWSKRIEALWGLLPAGV
jgi:glycosyltransferase involved in cell wall biosynthesis